MPTYEALAAFQRQYGKLDAAQKDAFRRALGLRAIARTAGTVAAPLPCHASGYVTAGQREGRPALAERGPALTAWRPRLVAQWFEKYPKTSKITSVELVELL